MPFSQYKNLNSQNLYRWDSGISTFQVIAENSRFLQTVGGTVANLKISSIQNSIGSDPSQWEEIGATAWNQTAENAINSISSALQESGWDQGSMYYFNTMNSSSYRWNLSEKKYQMAGTDNSDFSILRSLTGDYASNMCVMDSTMISKQQQIWNPVNEVSFLAGASAAIAKIQEKFL